MSDTAPRGVLLSGGIGSGKSTAARFLEGLGAAIISSDEAAHRAIAPDGPVFGAVAARWPGTVVDGAIDRGALAESVFGDSDELAALEAITHPVIGIDIAERVAAADAPLVVVEIPLLTAAIGRGWPRIVVDAPDEVRVSRLLARGMARSDVEARMAAQPSREEWLAAADHVIDNGGDMDTLAFACAEVFERLTGPGYVTGSR